MSNVNASLEAKITEFEKHILFGRDFEAAAIFKKDICDGTIYDQENGFEIIESVVSALSTISFSTALGITKGVYNKLSDDEKRVLIKTSVSSISPPKKKYIKIKNFHKSFSTDENYFDEILFGLEMEALAECSDAEFIFNAADSRQCELYNFSKAQEKCFSLMYDVLDSTYDDAEALLSKSTYMMQNLDQADDRLFALAKFVVKKIPDLKASYKIKGWSEYILEDYGDSVVTATDRGVLEKHFEQAKKDQKIVEQYIENTPLTTQKFIQKYKPQSGQHLKS